MPRHLSLDEDIALKRLVTMPRDQKPDFSWREAIATPAHPLCLVSEQGTYVHPVPHPCQLSFVALVCACWFARRTAGQACSQGGSTTSRLHQWYCGCCTTSGRGGRGRRWGWRRGPWWVGCERRCCQRRHGGQEEALPSITTRTSLTLVTLPTWIRSAVSAGPLPVSRDTHHTQTHPLPRPSVPITAVVRRTNSPPNGSYSHP